MSKIKTKRIIAILLTFLISVSTFNINNVGINVVRAEENAIDDSEMIEKNENELTNEEDANTDSSELRISDGKYQGEGYNVDFVIDNQWDSGFNATVTINNTSDTKIENWSIIMPLHNNISNIWNAVVSDTYDDFYVIKNAGWNQDIPENGSISFGISSNEKFEGFPKYYNIVGSKIETRTSDYKIEYAVTDAWEDGLIGQIKITNTRDTAIEDWRMHFSYDAEIIEIWDAVVVSHENNIYEISCENYNQNIQAGKFVTFGFKVSFGAVGEPAEMKLEEYSDGNKKYIAVMGEQIEDGIFLSTICSNKCDEYVYYISKDGKDYSELSRTHENDFLYDNKERNEGKLYFYVVGNNKSENLKSECVIVEYSDNECVITNYDTDSDLLCDYLEYCYGTDVENKDTDGDGLSDYYEVEYTMTDPLLVDTDNDGVSDYDMDIEGEGLKNYEEMGYGTNPVSSDTDGDNLTDYDEIYIYGTNPLVADTDGDRLTDYDDLKLGFDPLIQDTDGNGVMDGDEKVEQTVKYEFDNKEKPGVCSVSVTLNTSGNIEDKITIEDMYGLDAMSSDVVGLYGIPVEIQCDVPFDTAKITFEYDETYLEETEEDDLSIMWYNESDDWYQLLDEDCIIDKENNTISYITTHFSTYMLVRSAQWYNAWRENIDYRSSGQGDNKHSFDLAFVVDTSGSMSGARMKTTKAALTKFIDSMENNDSAALIGFSSYATRYSDFESSKDDLKKYINKLDAKGGTSVKAGLTMAYDLFSSINTNNQKAIVLICDGDVDKIDEIVEKCKNKKIKIFVLNIKNESTHRILQSVAQKTGGEYYYGSAEKDIETQMGKIQGVTTDKIDTTDTDKDGLYDIIERAGIRLSNGTVIHTNYKKSDTDGDGLSDYNETGIIYNIDNRYIGKNNSSRVRYFKLRSNPTKADSDNDGIDDKKDNAPWKKNTMVIASLKNKYKNAEYICVQESKDKNSEGGNQEWWSKEIVDKRVCDSAYRMAELGCGVIAMSDVELYLCNQKGYKPVCKKVKLKNKDGVIKKDDYMDYVQDLYENRYKIGNNPVNAIAGLLPQTMQSQLLQYLKKNNVTKKKVKWGEASDLPIIGQRNHVKNGILDTINGGFPCVCSSYRLRKEKLYGYTNKEKAINNDKDRVSLNSHYMTIIRVEKELDIKRDRYFTFYVIVSWGRVWYVKEDDYLKVLDYNNNILSVK